MSKISKNYGWLNTRPNSSKTLLERAKREVPGFLDHIRKFEEQITIKSYALFMDFRGFLGGMPDLEYLKAGRLPFFPLLHNAQINEVLTSKRL